MHFQSARRRREAIWWHCRPKTTQRTKMRASYLTNCKCVRPVYPQLTVPPSGEFRQIERGRFTIEMKVCGDGGKSRSVLQMGILWYNVLILFGKRPNDHLSQMRVAHRIQCPHPFGKGSDALDLGKLLNVLVFCFLFAIIRLLYKSV